MVGIDGSSGSMTALWWAARTAARHRIPLHLVSAVGSLGEPDHDRGNCHQRRRDAACGCGDITVHRT
ncbi:universal stress protein [Nocardia carnea]|uniref:universal stress protein n=1 Tax=Nocardia carnea TaxID=37328 RepID=UPI0032AF24A0